MVDEWHGYRPARDHIRSCLDRSCLDNSFCKVGHFIGCRRDHDTGPHSSIRSNRKHHRYLCGRRRRAERPQRERVPRSRYDIARLPPLTRQYRKFHLGDLKLLLIGRHQSLCRMLRRERHVSFQLERHAIHLAVQYGLGVRHHNASHDDRVLVPAGPHGLLDQLLCERLDEQLHRPRERVLPIHHSFDLDDGPEWQGGGKYDARGQLRWDWLHNFGRTAHRKWDGSSDIGSCKWSALVREQYPLDVTREWFDRWIFGIHRLDPLQQQDQLVVFECSLPAPLQQ